MMMTMIVVMNQAEWDQPEILGFYFVPYFFFTTSKIRRGSSLNRLTMSGWGRDSRSTWHVGRLYNSWSSIWSKPVRFKQNNYVCKGPSKKYVMLFVDQFWLLHGLTCHTSRDPPP